MSRRSYQKQDGDASLWKSYEETHHGEMRSHFHQHIRDGLVDTEADSVWNRVDKERTLKGILEFFSKSTFLSNASFVVEKWCDVHNGALENMGVGEVLRVIKIKPPQIQTIVLAYFLLAVGYSTACGWSKADRGKLFMQYPMLDVYHKLVALGVSNEFTGEVIKAVIFFQQRLLEAG